MWCKKPITGIYNLTFELGSATCVARVCVVDNLDKDLILGNDFLHTYSAVLDFADRKLQFREAVKFKPSKAIHIEPQTSVLMGLTAHSCDGVDKLTGLTGVIEDHTLAPGLVLQAAAVTLSEGTVPVLISNHTDIMHSINPDDHKVLFTPFTADDQVYDLQSISCNGNTIQLDK